MKITKIIGFCLITGIFTAGTIFAQDFGFDNTENASETKSALEFGGSGGVSARAWIDTVDGYGSFEDIGSRTKTDYFPFFNLNTAYSGDRADFEAKLKFNKNSLGDYKWDMLDELTARLYAGDWVIEGGKMRVVWGKGDKLHVVDNFNANDYTDFVIPDYIDRRIAEPMFRVIYNSPLSVNLRIEGIITPVMTADRFAKSGEWSPFKMAKISGIVRDTLGYNLTRKLVVSELATTRLGAELAKPTPNPVVVQTLQSAAAKATADYTAYLSYVNGINSNPESLYPDTAALEYAQAGLRATATLGSVDVGLSYYYGHNKQLSVNMKKYLSSYTSALRDLPEFSYDKLQVFGIEAAAAIWRFNVRAEGAYNMTDDFAGDKPWVHNNSIAWLFGFDIDIPVSNLNLNVQECGKHILKSSAIGSYGTYPKEYDVDYDSDGIYVSDKLVINLSDKYLNDKLTAECSCIIGIENKEIAVFPKISWNVYGGFNLILSGAFIHADDEDGEFYNFTAYQSGGSVKTRDKAFAEFAVKYDF
ncbi:MAG: hypothetical protein ACFNX0_06180 [Treponema sp.]